MYQRQWEAYGYRVRFEWDDAALQSLVLGVTLPDWHEVEVSEADVVFSLCAERGGIALKQNGEVKFQNLDTDSVPHNLKRLCHLDIATYSEALVFVHAGVVLTEFGLLVLPGRSFAGKSTLVKSLVDVGCRYYSDEYALVDEMGLVRPFPRALCVRREHGESDLLPATDLGWEAGLGPQPLSAIVSTRYEKDAVWSPHELSCGEAVLKLLENTVCARTEPQKAIRHLTAALPALRYETPRDESNGAAKRILESMKAQQLN